MNTLRLEEINLHSSYMVGQTEGNKYSFISQLTFLEQIVCRHLFIDFPRVHIII